MANSGLKLLELDTGNLAAFLEATCETGFHASQRLGEVLNTMRPGRCDPCDRAIALEKPAK